MRRTATLVVGILGIALGGLSLDLSRPNSLVAKSAMPDPALTGAPSQGTCVSCHSGGLDDGQGSLLIVGLPAEYTPGQGYGVVVALERLGSRRWGFEATALNGGGSMAGTLDDTPDPHVIGQTQAGITYISQTTSRGFDGTYADTLDGAGWGFYWIAPPVGTGTVTFYAAGAACDNNGSAGATDYTYTTSMSVTEGAPTDVKGTSWGQIKRIYR